MHTKAYIERPSVRWFRRCPAQLGAEHQRRRGVPPGGLQRGGCPRPDCRGAEGCERQRQRAGYCRGQDRAGGQFSTADVVPSLQLLTVHQVLESLQAHLK